MREVDHHQQDAKLMDYILEEEAKVRQQEERRGSLLHTLHTSGGWLGEGALAPRQRVWPG